MTSLYDKCYHELKRTKCDWCGDDDCWLYDFEEENVCEHCLRTIEYEEPETGLTLEERNK